MNAVGMRVPRDFFVTSGVGESDITVHAGSYHLALREARVEHVNHITYSSILPATARQVERPDRADLTFGAVMETIAAVATCEYGSQATAGLIWGWLLDEHGTTLGGLVCEYSGPLPPENATAHLNAMLDELHGNGYERHRLVRVEPVLRSVRPEKMYGTAYVGLCFLSHTFSEARDPRDRGPYRTPLGRSRA